MPSRRCGVPGRRVFSWPGEPFLGERAREGCCPLRGVPSQGEGVPVGGVGALSAVRCPMGRGAVSRYVEGTTPLKESAPGKGKPAARTGERPAAGGGEGGRRASSCRERGHSFSTISRYRCRGQLGKA